MEHGTFELTGLKLWKLNDQVGLNECLSSLFHEGYVVFYGIYSKLLSKNGTEFLMKFFWKLFNYEMI